MSVVSDLIIFELNVTVLSMNFSSSSMSSSDEDCSEAVSSVQMRVFVIVNICLYLL